MKHLICIAFACLIATGGLWAQNANDYFQQKVDYTISVRLQPETNSLHASESIVYTNNSTNTLTEIWFHLWPNAYSNRQTAWAKQQLRMGKTDFHYAKVKERGGIDSLDFHIDGQRADWDYHKEHMDIAVVRLVKPLAPGQQVTITTPFKVDVPRSFSRLGHTGDQYQITQWYPKPAVFDQNGWHAMPYLDQGEFYSEFGSFDVTITVPENYAVASTGMPAPETAAAEANWTRNREASTRQLLERSSLHSGETPFPVDDSKSKPTKMKTLRYVQDQIHDFAWFADPQYFVMTENMTLPSGKAVELQAYFANNKDRGDWREALKYLREGVQYYSQFVGEYPYDRCIAVDGALSAGAGMEYPMITIVSASGSASVLRETIIHEVGHNWFYGILASNERQYPWMDEGMNTYIEHRAVKAAMAADRKKDGPQTGGIENPDSKFSLSKMLSGTISFAGYAYSQGANIDQPPTLPADDYWAFNYGICVYGRTGQLFSYLEQYLGTQMMDKCLHAYFQKWGYKHPYPKDVKAVFEEVSGKNLGWFFDEWLPAASPVRLSVNEFEIEDDGRLEIELMNRSNFHLPAKVSVIGENNDTLQTLWAEPFIGETELKLPVSGKVRRVLVGTQLSLTEPSLQNNLTGCAMPRLRFAASSDLRADRRDLYFLPAYGYNTRDGNMLGGLFSFQPFPKRGVEFHAMPMYSLHESHWTGSTGLTLRANQFAYGSALRKVEFHSRAALFADLLRAKHSVEFHFATPEKNRHRTSILTLRTHQLGWRAANGNLELQDDFRPYYTAADWQYEQDYTTWRWGLRAEAGAHDANAIRAQIAPFVFYQPAKEVKFNLRLFAGGFIERSNVPQALQYRMAGSFDPFGEEYYLDRRNFIPETETAALPATRESRFWSRQLSGDQGGFRSLLVVPGSDRWMTAVNFDVKLPYLFEIFYNYGVQPNAAGRSLDYYDAGVCVRVIDRVLHVNFPLAGSVYSEDFPVNWNQFGQQINFTLQLNEAIKRLPF